MKYSSKQPGSNKPENLQLRGKSNLEHLANNKDSCDSAKHQQFQTDLEKVLESPSSLFTNKLIKQDSTQMGKLKH